jgi:hypothetical protein
MKELLTYQKEVLRGIIKVQQGMIPQVGIGIPTHQAKVIGQISYPINTSQSPMWQRHIRSLSKG